MNPLFEIAYIRAVALKYELLNNIKGGVWVKAEPDHIIVEIKTRELPTFHCEFFDVVEKSSVDMFHCVMGKYRSFVLSYFLF